MPQPYSVRNHTSAGVNQLVIQAPQLITGVAGGAGNDGLDGIDGDVQDASGIGLAELTALHDLGHIGTNVGITQLFKTHISSP